jgi:methionyl-tRNA synthetase
MKAVNACNAFIQTHEPWSKTNDPIDNERTLATLFRAIQTLTAAIEPVVPTAAQDIRNALVLPGSLNGTDFWYRWRSVSADGATHDGTLTRPPIFFPRLDASHAA